jgi:hypothetical protein
MKHLETLHATSETQPQGSTTSSMPPSCRNTETPRSTFATFARNTCNILVEHLKHVDHTLSTCTNPVARHECLLVAVTACPLPRAIPYCSAPREPRGASRRRELRARALPRGAARHTLDRDATGGKAGGGGGAHSSESECLRGGEGATPPRYPDEGAAQRRGRGELRPSRR